MPAEVASRTIRAGSRLERILASGEFAVTAEIAPPASVDASEIRRHASLYRGTVDACNLTDGQRALVRISSMAAATIALQEGVEPIMQMVSRDRNRIGLQSDLLGAAALGIRNVLCLWGDPPTAGNEKEAKAVYDLSTEEMISTFRALRDTGVLRGGEMVEQAPNPRSEGVSIAVRTIKALKKIEGVHGVHVMPIGWEEIVPEIVKDAGLFPRPELAA